MERFPSGQRGQTVNLLAKSFGGSIPPLSTIFVMSSELWVWRFEEAVQRVFLRTPNLKKLGTETRRRE